MSIHKIELEGTSSLFIPASCTEVGDTIPNHPRQISIKLFSKNLHCRRFYNFPKKHVLLFFELGSFLKILSKPALPSFKPCLYLVSSFAWQGRSCSLCFLWHPLEYLKTVILFCHNLMCLLGIKRVLTLLLIFCIVTPSSSFLLTLEWPTIFLYYWQYKITGLQEDCLKRCPDEGRIFSAYTTAAQRQSYQHLQIASYRFCSHYVAQTILPNFCR